MSRTVWNGTTTHPRHPHFLFYSSISLFWLRHILLYKPGTRGKRTATFPTSRVLSFFPPFPSFFCRTGTWQYPDTPFQPFAATSLPFPSALQHPVSPASCLLPPQSSPNDIIRQSPPILADLQPKHTSLRWWTDCTFTSQATTVSRPFSEWFFQRSHHHFPLQR